MEESEKWLTQTLVNEEETFGFGESILTD